GDPELVNKGGRKQLRVMYYYKHTNHVLGNAKDFQHLRMTESTKARIRNLVRLGLCTRRIIAKINLSGRQAYSHHKNGRLQREHVLTYEDVYNIYHKHFSDLTKLSEIDLESMKLWMSRLQTMKQFTVFTREHNQRGKDGTFIRKFAYGFMSSFQKSVYSSNYRCIGLDSTHGTNRSKYELFTIIVQDPLRLSAVPVAFLITNDHSHHSLA
ncbi:hypothetical protein BGX27_006522, partial [Mortierella sp. AM989]